MPKGMRGYEEQPDGGYTRYEARGAKITKYGGNAKIHDGVETPAKKYPRPNAVGKGMTE